MIKYDDTEKSMIYLNKIISLQTKQFFKENIMNLMMNVDPKLIMLIKEMIVGICKDGGGYLNSWPELINIYSCILNRKNHKISVDIYDIINKIIKRYRIEFKSFALFEEIKKTIAEIGPILTEDGITCINFLFSDQTSNPELAILYMSLLKNILNIFISLNAQDFPEFFEDNLKSWMGILKGSLDFRIIIDHNSSNLNSLFINLQKTAMKALNMYCNYYYEDFIDYHSGFLPSVWNILNIIKHDDIYTKLVREILDYYKIIFQYGRTQQFDSSIAHHIISILILPEMKMTNKEMDDFEENPINFLKIELEEADMDSNKYHAINLLKNLNNTYPNITNEYIKPYINNLLEKYYSNPGGFWMEKIIAINLIFATMIKTFAQRIGATEINVSNEEISALIELVFLKEFQITSKPMTKIYSLKFLSTFRLQIPPNWLNSIINMLIDVMKSSDNVIQTTCLLTLEKILFIKELKNNSISFVKEVVNNETTFVSLINILVKITSTSINIFAMRCLFRTIFLTSEAYYKPIIESFTSSVNEMIKIVIANTSEDQFNYYLFETIAITLKKLNAVDMSLYSYFENGIRGNLTFILENSITDLMGYTIQIFSLELFLSPSQYLDTFHESILNSILTQETNWTLPLKFMFTPFVTFIKIALNKCLYYFVENKKNINQLFLIIEKLLVHKSYSITFELIESIINNLEYEMIYDKFKNLFYNFIVIYENLKLNNRKAFREFSKILVVFISKFLIKTSPKQLIELMEGVSQGLTVGLLSELSEFIQELENNKNKRLVTYAYCSLISQYYSAFDSPTLKLFTWRLIQHLEKFYKVSISNLGGEIDKLLEKEPSYDANNFNKLYNAETRSENELYEKVYQLDENFLFYSTINSIKSATNMNLIEVVYETLTDREKEYVKNTSKNYSK